MSQIAASFLRRCFAPEETIAVLLRRQDAAAPMQRVVRLEQVLETPVYGVALLREPTWSQQHLCRCQSASPWQPEAYQRVHRIRSPSIYRHRHGWRCPARCAPGIGYGAAADLDSLHIARQISGALAGRRVSTLRGRNRRSSCSPLPSAAIPLAPTATVSCASPVS